jgi:hypothetical protein
MRTKTPDLRKALSSRFREHHGFLLKQMLDHVEAQAADIAALDEQIEAALTPLVDQVELLATHPRGRAPMRPGHPRRDRPRHVRLPHHRPSRVVGWDVPGATRLGGQPRIG